MSFRKALQMKKIILITWASLIIMYCFLWAYYVGFEYGQQRQEEMQLQSELQLNYANYTRMSEGQDRYAQDQIATSLLANVAAYDYYRANDPSFLAQHPKMALYAEKARAIVNSRNYSQFNIAMRAYPDGHQDVPIANGKTAAETFLAETLTVEHNFVFISLIGEFLFTLAVGLPWLFFLLHAVQRTEDPVQRAEWVIFFLFFNIFIIPFYYFMRYRDLCREGKGGIIGNKTWTTKNSIFRTNDATNRP